MSGIWTHDEDQARIAIESRAAEGKRRGKAIATEIAPLREFTRAEDYHQKYYLRNERELMKEFEGIPDDARFVDSTAATRVNAAVGGHLGADLLKAEIDRYGLSAKGRERILRYVR